MFKKIYTHIYILVFLSNFHEFIATKQERIHYLFAIYIKGLNQLHTSL